MKKYLVAVIFLSLIALWPFFRKGFFESHDGEWMVIRFTAFHQTLASGQFPVRFVDRLNNNYGYPVLNFLYPLPFYLAEIPKVLGFGFVDSVKSVFVVSTVSSVVAMFWALSAVFDKRASFAGSILYLFIPYRFVDLYVRGSLGENLAFLFIPLVAGSIFRIARGQKIFLPILSLAMAALILSHNVIAILFLPFLIITAFLLIEKAKRETFLAFFLGILISTFFWLPAIYDLKFVRLSYIQVSTIADHLVNFSNLIAPSWGYGPNPNGGDPLPVQIGIVPIFIIAISAYLHFKSKIKNTYISFLLLIIVGVILLMTKVSLPAWQTVLRIDVIQFPWRMLSLMVFVVSFLTASLIGASRQKNLMVAILTIAAITSTIVYTKPANFTNKGDSFYATNEDSTTVRDEYLPLWVKEKPKQRADQKIIVENGQILSANIAAANYQAVIKTDQETNVQVNSIYFPGWQVKVDGKLTLIDYQNPYGLLNFKLPKGTHQVIIKYARSPVHLTSEIVSLFALLVTGLYFYRLWPKRNS